MKNPLTPAGIEPATFRFVAQHLNHCATAVPSSFHGHHLKCLLYEEFDLWFPALWDEMMCHWVSGIWHFRVSGIPVKVLNATVRTSNLASRTSYWNATLLFLELLNWKWMYYAFIPLACAECDDSLQFSGASSILSYLILPSVSRSTSQSCCSQIHI